MTRTFTPHDYQREALDHLYNLRRSVLWMPMGGGKTVTVLTALSALDTVEEVFPALVLAPKRVVSSTWPQEAAKWAHTQALRVVPVLGTAKQREAALRLPADIYATNYDNVPWLVAHYGEGWPFKTVIADECFVAGTQVATPGGDRPIESLSEGEEVLTHVGPRRIRRVYRRFSNDFNLVCLTLGSGVKIYATKTHPFFTDAGWLPAEACGGRRLYGRDCLSDLSDALLAKGQPSAHAGGTGQDPVLLHKLPVEGGFRAPGAPRVEPPKHDGHSAEARAGRYACLELWKAMVRDPSGDDVGGPEEQAVPRQTGRQRDWHDEHRGADCAAAAGRVPLESHSVVEGGWGRISVALQTRLRGCQPDGVLGGGWAVARDLPRYGAGSEEDREATVVGVDRVSDQEHGGLVPVFNLEVEGAPTYFANGVLVHNCSKLKSYRTRQGGSRARALAKVAHTKSRRFIGLTGTPAPNGLKDLWGQVWFVDRGERLGRTFSAFEARWFTKGWDGYSLQPREFAQAEIEDRLKDVCLTVKGLDVDEPIRNVIEVELPKDARKTYEEMERDMWALIEGEGVEAVNAAVRTSKCLQLSNGAVYKEDGSWAVVHDEKIDALKSVVEEANGMPVLVAYNFKSDLARILAAVPGAKPLDDNPKTIVDWNAGRIPVLVAHPASAGHGLNLQDGGNILAFFGLNWNLEEHDQIIERIGPQRQKQSGYDRPVFIHYILARGTVDAMVLDRLVNKRSVQDVLLEAMKRRSET